MLFGGAGGERERLNAYEQELERLSHEAFEACGTERVWKDARSGQVWRSVYAG